MIDTLAFILTGLGLAASIVYYANILNNANKTRELQLRSQELATETRQAQLFMQSYRETSTIAIQKLGFEILTWTWTDYEDFKHKYIANPEQMSKLVTFLLYWHGLGILLHEGYIPVDILYKMDQDGAAPITFWSKVRDPLMGMRRDRNQPNLMKYFEYYVEEMIKIRKANGLPAVYDSNSNRFIE